MSGNIIQTRGNGKPAIYVKTGQVYTDPINGAVVDDISSNRLYEQRAAFDVDGVPVPVSSLRPAMRLGLAGVTDHAQHFGDLPGQAVENWTE